MQRDNTPTCLNIIERVLQGFEEIFDQVKAADEWATIDDAAFQRKFLDIVLSADDDDGIDNLENFLRFCVRNHAESSELGFEEAAKELAESPHNYYFFEVEMLRNSGVEVPSNFPTTVCLNLATSVHLLLGGIINQEPQQERQ